MKRLTFLLIVLVIIALAAFTLLASGNRARLAQTLESTQPAQAKQNDDCGCHSACMGTNQCAIKCPVGQAAHCDCKTVGARGEQQPNCYCR